MFFRFGRLDERVFPFLWILAIVASAAVVAAWLWIKRTRAAGGTCNKCGYSLRGAVSWICPECGSDVREVGICGMSQPWISASTRRLLTWTFALLIVAPALSAFLATFVPNRIEVRHQIILTGPVSGAYERISITGNASGYPPSPNLLTLHTELTKRDGTRSQISLDIPGRTVTYKDEQGRYRSSSLSPTLALADLLDWLEASGIDASTEATRAEAELIHETICWILPRRYEFKRELTNLWEGVPTNLFLDVKLVAPPGQIGYATSYFPEWYWPSAAAFWSVVWLTGGWRITRR